MRSSADRRARRETSAGATLLRPCDLFFAKALRDFNQHKLLSVLCLPARVFWAYREAALATVCGRCAIGTLNTQSNYQKSQRSPGERSRARRGEGRLF